MTCVELNQKIYNQRIIIVDCGVQMGQVVIGRDFGGGPSQYSRRAYFGGHHSARGRQVLADAVRPVGRLSRPRPSAGRDGNR